MAGSSPFKPPCSQKCMFISPVLLHGMLHFRCRRARVQVLRNCALRGMSAAKHASAPAAAKASSSVAALVARSALPKALWGSAECGAGTSGLSVIDCPAVASSTGNAMYMPERGDQSSMCSPNVCDRWFRLDKVNSWGDHTHAMPAWAAAVVVMDGCRAILALRLKLHVPAAQISQACRLAARERRPGRTCSPNCCCRWLRCWRTMTGGAGSMGLLPGTVWAVQSLWAGRRCSGRPPPPAMPLIHRPPLAASLHHSCCRFSVMHTCCRWYSTIATGPPDLLPARVLVCPPLEMTRLRRACYDCAEVQIQEAYDTDMTSTLKLVVRAANVPRRAWRVRVEGGAQVGRVWASICSTCHLCASERLQV